MENYEVEHDFPSIGRRTMLLNARKVFYEKGSHSTILLGIEDITDKRILENEKDELIRQKQVLLEELEHRVANSLQIIASIIMLKAAAIGGVTRSGLGTNSTIAARPPGLKEACTFFMKLVHVGGSKWCRKLVSSTIS